MQELILKKITFFKTTGTITSQIETLIAILQIFLVESEIAKTERFTVFDESNVDSFSVQSDIVDPVENVVAKQNIKWEEFPGFPAENGFIDRLDLT